MFTSCWDRVSSSQNFQLKSSYSLCLAWLIPCAYLELVSDPESTYWFRLGYVHCPWSRGGCVGWSP